MEREGNTAEQPIAPDLSTEPTDSSVAVDTTTETSSHQTTPEAVQTAQPTQTEEANKQTSPQPRKNKKRIGIIAGIAVAVLLIIAGIAALAINLTNKNQVAPAASDATVKDITKEINQLSENSNIDGLIYYINDITTTKNDGSSHQNLTNQDMGDIYKSGMMSIMNYINKNQDLGSEQKDNYTSTAISYAHSADDMLQTGGSAASVYVAESAFGNMEVANQYLQLAKERGINYNIEPEGQE